MEIQTNSVVIAQKAMEAANNQSTNIVKVTEMLMDQMIKLKGNPGEIEISNAMVGVAGRILDAAKIQLQATELVLKANGSL